MKEAANNGNLSKRAPNTRVRGSMSTSQLFSLGQFGLHRGSSEPSSSAYRHAQTFHITKIRCLICVKMRDDI
jgi:hypothetical protein